MLDFKPLAKCFEKEIYIPYQHFVEYIDNVLQARNMSRNIVK